MLSHFVKQICRFKKQNKTKQKQNLTMLSGEYSRNERKTNTTHIVTEPKGIVDDVRGGHGGVGVGSLEADGPSVAGEAPAGVTAGQAAFQAPSLGDVVVEETAPDKVGTLVQGHCCQTLRAVRTKYGWLVG